MTQETPASSFGKLDILIPEATYEAGKLSTVSIIIRNPFDTSVDILNIQGPRSSHLRQITNNKKHYNPKTMDHHQNHYFKDSHKKFLILELRKFHLATFDLISPIKTML
jgi:hypothetical protein